MLLGIQTAFLVPLLVSIAFRARGYYFAHGTSMIIAVVVELVESFQCHFFLQMSALWIHY